MSFNRRMYKLWYIQTMKYFLIPGRNEPSRHEKTWRKLKCLLLSESNQSEKAINSTIPTERHVGKGKTTEIVKRTVVSMGLGKEG